MVLEHEIPKGSKLYFGESAKIKRELESISAAILQNSGYEEIVTPSFSFLNFTRSDEDKKLLRLSSEKNHTVVLRFDSTLDVANIIDNRLGKSTNHKKWFYIQPVFSYPTIEEYQIGVEHLDSDRIEEMFDISIAIFKKLKIDPVLQICNVNIPKILDFEGIMKLDSLKGGDFCSILESKYSWLSALAASKSVEELKFIKDVPSFLKDDINRLIELGEYVKSRYESYVLSPLYLPDASYYKDIFFRMFYKNSSCLMGGTYELDGSNSCGLAIYTDKIIDFYLED